MLHKNEGATNFSTSKNNEKNQQTFFECKCMICRFRNSKFLIFPNYTSS